MARACRGRVPGIPAGPALADFASLQGYPSACEGLSIQLFPVPAMNLAQVGHLLLDWGTGLCDNLAVLKAQAGFRAQAAWQVGMRGSSLLPLLWRRQ